MAQAKTSSQDFWLCFCSTKLSNIFSNKIFCGFLITSVISCLLNHHQDEHYLTWQNLCCSRMLLNLHSASIMFYLPLNVQVQHCFCQELYFVLWEHHLTTILFLEILAHLTKAVIALSSEFILCTSLFWNVQFTGCFFWVQRLHTAFFWFCAMMFLF